MYFLIYPPLLQGAHLASIHSAEENQFIYDSYGGEAEEDIWIGGRRQGDSYSWLDGTPWDYQNWSPKNPSGGGEECAEIFANSNPDFYPSKWNDDTCTVRNSFVCQLTPTIGRYCQAIIGYVDVFLPYCEVFNLLGFNFIINY